MLQTNAHSYRASLPLVRSSRLELEHREILTPQASASTRFRHDRMWWAKRDLNSHVLRQQILSLPRLPLRHSPVFVVRSLGLEPRRRVATLFECAMSANSITIALHLPGFEPGRPEAIDFKSTSSTDSDIDACCFG